MVKQAKLHLLKYSLKYKYGFEIPRNYADAGRLDKKNGNHNWYQVNKLEHAQLEEYKVFTNKGKFAGNRIPRGYQLIRVHIIFDVKVDGRHKARVVANGHLTTTPKESVYSGVVSLRGLRTCLFIGELDGMETWATDIGNAYLKALTSEKVCIRAGREFEELEGHWLIIYKALYGLKTSRKAFGQLLQKYLHSLGFALSLAEASIFLRKCPTADHYEYVATYVDNLAIIMKDPQSLIDQLIASPHDFKLKGSGPLNFHFGCGFDHDKDGTLYMDPGKYIDRMMEAYEKHFRAKPDMKHRSPLQKGDHHELDTIPFLDKDGKEIYQSLIRCGQWNISIRRFDTQSAVMSMSRYRNAPREGHLERVKRIFGYLCRFKHFKLRFRVNEPDYLNVPAIPDHDWGHRVYGKYEEDIAKNIPEPLG